MLTTRQTASDKVANDTLDGEDVLQLDKPTTHGAPAPEALAPVHFIGEWMKYRKMKPADLVRVTGADKGLVSRWINKGIIPRKPYLVPLATLFSIDIGNLFQSPDTSAHTQVNSFEDGFREAVQYFRSDTEAGLPEMEGDFHFYARMIDNSLDQLGIVKDQVLIFDFGPGRRKEATGDIVMAQHYGDEFPSGAITIIRQFIAPSMLITNSSGANYRPLNTENESDDVMIRAIIVLGEDARPLRP